MTYKTLKKQVKKLAIILLIVLIVIIALSVYTLKGKKADLSIYTNAGYVDNPQVLGMNEDELKEYLSVFGNLIDDHYNENQRQLNMAISFVENMYSSYDIQVDENGSKYYPANIIHKIIEEIQGTYISEKIDDSKIYTYHPDGKYYTQNEIIDRISYCTEISDIQKKEDKIEVTYSLAIMTKEQMEEYITGQAVEFEKHRVKITIMKNSDYEYSKYFVSSIEEL